MATSGTRGLQRQSFSSERARRTIKTIEAQLGTTISSDTSDHSTSETLSSKQRLGNNNEGSMDQTD
jgi:hypothetical protein